MAVLVQFTTLLIRIDRLTAVAPDGVAAVQARWSPSWRDEHLLAVAFMDMGARELAAELEQMGLTLRDTSSGTRVWQDICVVDYYDGPTNPCPWLAYDPDAHVAWLAGRELGAVAGPEHRHEEAPIRVTPEKMQQLMQQQHGPGAPARPAEPEATHEDLLLPIARTIAEELLNILPVSLKIEAVIFMASFPAPGKFVRAGVVLHDLDGETRQMKLPPLTERARELLRALSLYESDNRLTSIEIKIAAGGATTTQFGIAPPMTEDQLKAQLQRKYGGVPEGRAKTLPPAGCVMGLLRSFGFGPKLTLYPRLALSHAPQREPLSLFLDELRRIDEGWNDAPAEPPAPASEPIAPVFALAELHALEDAREGKGPPAVAVAAGPGEPLAVPEQEGVLAVEARELLPGSLAELHRKRPTLRFDPIAETLTRDLGPELGTLELRAWQGNVTGFRLRAEKLPSLDALLARLRPVLAALGGMGPVVDARGAQRPAGLREHRPVTIDELRGYLVPDSPYGTLIYPCFLLGGPSHVVVKLDLGAGIEGGRPVYSFTVAVELP